MQRRTDKWSKWTVWENGWKQLLSTATMLVGLLSSNQVDKSIQELFQKFVWRFCSFSRSMTNFIFLPIKSQSVSDVYLLQINFIRSTRWYFFSFMCVRLLVLLNVWWLFVPLTIWSFIASHHAIMLFLWAYFHIYIYMCVLYLITKLKKSKKPDSLLKLVSCIFIYPYLFFSLIVGQMDIVCVTLSLLAVKNECWNHIIKVIYKSIIWFVKSISHKLGTTLLLTPFNTFGNLPLSNFL